jgi:hypothetical protein
MRVGMRFTNIQQLHDFITKEATSRKIPLLNFFHAAHSPCKANWTNLRMTCNGKCRAVINIKKEEHGVVVTSLITKHVPKGIKSSTGAVLKMEAVRRSINSIGLPEMSRLVSENKGN